MKLVVNSCQKPMAGIHLFNIKCQERELKDIKCQLRKEFHKLYKISPPNLKTVIYCTGHQNFLLATARGYGDYKGWWEFPGRKIETGETLMLLFLKR